MTWQLTNLADTSHGTLRKSLTGNDNDAQRVEEGRQQQNTSSNRYKCIGHIEIHILADCGINPKIVEGEMD